MASNSKAANGSLSNVFFFKATEALPGHIAAAISDFYGFSILVHSSVAEQRCTGRLVARSFKEAIDGLAFMVGATVRQHESNGVWLVGGPKVEVLTQMPSFGLNASQVSAALRGANAKLVGDRIVVETDQTRASELRDVVQVFGDRPSLNLEIVMLDVLDASINRVNAWLDQFSVSAGYAARSFFQPGAAMAEGVEQVRYGGPVYDVNVQTLFAFLEVERGARVQLREQVQILSGGRSEFGSGEVVETPLIVREPETGKDLVQRIERRTVGLQLTIGAVAWADKWHLTINISDSARGVNGERTTTLTTERILEGPGGFVQLASFTRDVEETVTRQVPVLGEIPWVKKAFRKSETSVGKRQVIILARRAGVR